MSRKYSEDPYARTWCGLRSDGIPAARSWMHMMGGSKNLRVIESTFPCSLKIYIECTGKEIRTPILFGMPTSRKPKVCNSYHGSSKSLLGCGIHLLKGMKMDHLNFYKTPSGTMVPSLNRISDSMSWWCHVVGSFEAFGHNLHFQRQTPTGDLWLESVPFISHISASSIYFIYHKKSIKKDHSYHSS